MAIIIQSEPEAYSLAYNDNVWTFDSVPTNSTRRFIVNVMDYATTTLIAKLTVYPTQLYNGTGEDAFVDVSKIVQSKMPHDLSIPTSTHLGFLPNTESHFEYTLIIQEETLDANGEYEQVFTHFTTPKSVWNGVEDLVDWLDFDLSNYLMTSSIGAQKFLTDGPVDTGFDVRYRDIGSDESASLYFIGSEDNAPAWYHLRTYSEHDEGGTLLSSIYVANPYATAMTAGYSKRFTRIPIGTSDIPLINASQFSSGSPSTVLNNVKSYSIELQNSGGLQISNTVIYNIDKNCSKYTPIRLHWMNKLGGFDHFNFELKSEKKTDVDRRSYRQQHRRLTSTGWKYNKTRRGRTEYAIQTTKGITVNTHYLDDFNSKWMESLFTSPVIYQELNGELISINIDGRSIAEKTSLNDKLCQYTFDLEYSLTNNRQRG